MTLVVDGKTWVNHLDGIRRNRDYYIKDKWFKNRGKWYPTKVRRPALNTYLVTLAPWWSEVVHWELRDGNVAGVEWFIFEWVLASKKLWERLTGREVVGLAVHCDTQNLHLDISSTRVSATHGFLLGSDRWIGSAGSQPPGVLRQLRAGFRTSADSKVRAAEYRCHREVERHGREPIGLQFNNLTDDLCYSHFGGSRHRDAAWRAYRPDMIFLERMHLVREREALVRLLEVFDGLNGGAK